MRNKLFRFLVTVPPDSCPTPIAKGMEEEIALLLRRHFDKVKVRTLKRTELVIEPFPLVNIIPGVVKDDIARKFRKRMKGGKHG